MKDSIKVAGMLVAATVTSCMVAWAEGTKSVFHDAGLYPGTDLWTWAAGTVQANALLVMANAPEGRQVLSLAVDRPWGGGGFFFISGGQLMEMDCSEYAGGCARFWLRSSDSLSVQIQSLAADGSVQKSSWTAPSTSDRWIEMVVPFTSFSPVPNLARIQGLFLITVVQGSGPKQWFLDDIRWTKPVQSLAIYPATAQVGPGGSVQFTVEGKSAANETVLVNPTFAVAPGTGTVTPGAPTPAMSTTFTAGSSTASATVTATLTDPGAAPLTVTAPVIVVAAPSATFWLYTESNPLSVTPDTDSQIVVFQGGSAAPLILTETSGDACEGTKSLQATVNNSDDTGFAGWAYQWGLTNSTDADTIDMSPYLGASLAFCLNTPADLVGKVHVGIRSGNVPAGTELSYVVLTNADIFDDTWHEVAVPVKTLAGATPFADLSRTKIFFDISVVGATSGTESFSVDNLRWEPEQALAFTHVGLRPDGDFYLVLSGAPGTSFILSRSRDLRAWEDVLTNALGTAAFEFTETNSARSPSFFYRARRQ